MTGKRRELLVSVVVLICAGALRLLASMDDFWLDEIWSWVHVQTRVKSGWDVLLTLRHDNNHMLNSWWIYLLGPDADRVWYRLPPVVFGSLTVLLARQAVAKSGPAAVWAVTVLTVPSYLLVHYSSEARGYGYELFFCLAAFLLLDRLLHEDWPSKSPLDRRGLRDRGLFAACCVAGGLAHPAFYMMFVALGLWAAWVTVRSRTSWGAVFRWLFGVLLLPAALLFLLWLVNLSRMEIGGGPPEIPWLVAIETLSLMVGGPEAGETSLWIGLAVAFAVTVQLIRMARTGDDRWVCASAMIVIPAGVLMVTGTEQIYPRYLLGTVILLLPLLAQLLALCFAQGIAGRSFALLLLGLTLIGNGWQLARLWEFGRGHGQAVVEFLRDHSEPGPILIGSDPPPLRHAYLLGYFQRRLGLNNRLFYLGDFVSGQWPPQGPQWVLFHSQAKDVDWPPTFTDRQGNRYELRRVFRYAGLSGWHTGVYENVKSYSERGT